MKYYAHSPVEGFIPCESKEAAEEVAGEILKSYREGPSGQHWHPGDSGSDEIYVCAMVKVAIVADVGVQEVNGEPVRDFQLKQLAAQGPT